ncbi:MAG: hypothetical protein JWM87_3674 [Candidatus Eremiobacteraeota bacterium]|nr:hypothetical protein [Candidatus Eremiobacteraeota bacterium]
MPKIATWILATYLLGGIPSWLRLVHIANVRTGGGIRLDDFALSSEIWLYILILVIAAWTDAITTDGEARGWFGFFSVAFLMAAIVATFQYNELTTMHMNLSDSAGWYRASALWTFSAVTVIVVAWIVPAKFSDAARQLRYEGDYDR